MKQIYVSKVTNRLRSTKLGMFNGINYLLSADSHETRILVDKVCSDKKQTLFSDNRTTTMDWSFQPVKCYGLIPFSPVPFARAGSVFEMMEAT